MAGKKRHFFPSTPKNPKKKEEAEPLAEIRPADRKKFCFLCRHKGHTMASCPRKQKKTKTANANSAVQGEDAVPLIGICFNCGESGHSLWLCPMPRSKTGELKFASCFVCGERGHLSRNCPQNPNGVYPKGGCCHICGGKDHLVKDCPKKLGVRKADESDDEEDKEREGGEVGEGDELDGNALIEEIAAEGKKRKKKNSAKSSGLTAGKEIPKWEEIFDKEGGEKNEGDGDRKKKKARVVKFGAGK